MMSGVRYAFTYQDLIGLIEKYVPCWEAHVHGPPVYPSLEPKCFTISGIVGPRDSVDHTVEWHIRRSCESWGREYDEDDWTIVELIPLNQN